MIHIIKAHIPTADRFNVPDFDLNEIGDTNGMNESGDAHTFDVLAIDELNEALANRFSRSIFSK